MRPRFAGFSRSLATVLVLVGLAACDQGYTFTEKEEDPPIPLGTDEPEMGPVAVCSVDSNRIKPIHESTTFRGNESYDSDGHAIIGYEWTFIESPAGSAATLASSGAPSDRRFTPDMAGLYTAQLVVMNDQFVSSEPCQVNLEAVPDGDLWVEMFWDATGEDMDLHLTRENAGYESGGDCYFANCVGGLLWDNAGSNDDPSLDLDDIPGMGPENINISSPVADYYIVTVHDYPGSSRTQATNVTVKIHVGGVLLFEDTRSISGEDTYTRFARVDWASQTVSPL